MSWKFPKEGYSKIRNEALAHAFSYMNLIEHWGSGIPRIIGKVKAAGLREPEFIGGEVDLRINIYRGQSNDAADVDSAEKMPDSASIVPDSTGKVPDSAGTVPDSASTVPDSASTVPDSTGKVPETDQEKQIYKVAQKNGFVTRVQVMELLDIKERRARNLLRKMVESGWLRREGAARSTIYVNNTEGR